MLNGADWLIIGSYFAGTLLIGLLSRRKQGTAGSFLNASRTLPLWVAALAFLASNCGALELVGLAAVSAQYGVVALDYYWIGAVPALLVLALCILPMYMQSHATSVPDFLGLRFGQPARRFNAVSVLVLSILLAGISLYAMAGMLHPILGWSFGQSTVVVAAFVFGYLVLGGLRASIFNEILQLALIVGAIGPLSFIVLRHTHGIAGLLADPAIRNTHLWRGLPLADASAPADCLGIAFGLGFVLAFGYWTTDFLLIQRALSLRDTRQAPLLPLIAAAGKLLFPLLVVVPGLAAAPLFARFARGAGVNYDLALSRMIEREYPHGLLGLGISALLAALMSALAGNVAAAAAVWTEDVYRSWLVPQRSEQHYLAMGRIATGAAALMGVATAFLALHFTNLMDYIQLIFSLFSAPLFAVVSLEMFTRWATQRGGFWGLVVGTAAGCTHSALARVELLHYGSQMSANFYGALYAWLAAMAATGLVSMGSSPFPAGAAEAGGKRKDLRGPAQRSFRDGAFPIPLHAWVLALLIASACVALNLAYR